MKKRKIALYDPYLDTLGGGEKHVLSILKVFENKGWQPNIFWGKDLRSAITERFGLSFSDVNFLPNYFHRNNLWEKLGILKQFDVFIYVTDGSYFFSTAKNNFIFCMYPLKKLFARDLLSRLKTVNYRYITNSRFTQKKLMDWGISSNVIYPYLDNEFFNADKSLTKKKRTILSVGRFFSHLHSKRQDKLIDSFKILKQQNPLFKDFNLILAGGMADEDKPFMEHIIKLVGSDASIKIIANPAFNDLLQLYRESEYYWHFAGFGVNENRNPELVEHLGITPLEAMASGCLTYAYSAGGPKEVIEDNVNGFLFSAENELFGKMLALEKNPDLKNKIIEQSQLFVRKNFAYENFEHEVTKLQSTMK